MKLTVLIALLLANSLLFASPYAGPQLKVFRTDTTVSRVMEGGDFLDVPELAVFFSKNGDNIAVTNVMDAETRPKGNEKIDIQLEDIVLMANGKRIKELSDLQTIYKDTKPGTTIKLGIKRGEEMKITSFDKIDPEKLPKRKMIIRHGGGDEGEDMMAMPQVGLFFSSKGKEVKIAEIIDDAPAKAKGDMKVGDIVSSINGKKVKSFEEFSSTYRNLAVGDAVEIITSRSGKTQTITFKKPENKGGMKIMRKN